jgi:predicted unusual protein kinase regulating ubiquinone biosynthesis (AarF/ABC1/UbiB family)
MTVDHSDFTTSRSSRFLKLGKLTSRVGSSYLGTAVKAKFQNAESKARSLLETNTKNAVRVVRTFGELKGAVMKVGQMLSLQGDLFPPEVREILSHLQNQAPPVPFAQMQPLLLDELGAKVENYFTEISESAYASASIGQVHRGRLRDGREVVVKIQYPGVAEMVESDLKNLRMFLLSVRQVTPVKADLERLFNEARLRLTEELDYRLELMNMQEFRELFSQDKRFIIPRPVPELSTRRVLTTEYHPGLTADELCQPSVLQDKRDRMGTYLLEAVLTQFFGFRILQADPNLANFAFTQDDRVILYDFGCVKRFPKAFVEGIRTLVRDAVLGRYQKLRGDAAAVGYIDKGKAPLPLEAYKAYADTAFSEWRKPGLYDFGATHIQQRLFGLHGQYWQKAFDFDAPADAIYMHRSFGGMYGNLCKLKAKIPMYDLINKHLRLNQSESPRV